MCQLKKLKCRYYNGCRFAFSIHKAITIFELYAIRKLLSLFDYFFNSLTSEWNIDWECAFDRCICTQHKITLQHNQSHRCYYLFYQRYEIALHLSFETKNRIRINFSIKISIIFHSWSKHCVNKWIPVLSVRFTFTLRKLMLISESFLIIHLF